jgi:hypothetical protein
LNIFPDKNKGNRAGWKIKYVFKDLESVFNLYSLNIFCVVVMYSGEYDACDVTLSVYPHQASLKNMPDYGGNQT